MQADATQRNTRPTWPAVTVLVTGWLSALLIMLASSYPGDGLIVGLAAAGVVLIAMLGWAILVMTELVGRRAGLLVTATVALIVLVGGAALAARVELPLLVRFAAARPAFDQVVADRGEVGPDARCPRWIGSYRIRECRTIGSDTYFTERDGGFLDRVGFVYLPEGVPVDPPTTTAITYGQLRGPWYWFVEAW